MKIKDKLLTALNGEPLIIISITGGVAEAVSVVGDLKAKILILDYDGNADYDDDEGLPTHDLYSAETVTDCDKEDMANALRIIGG